MPQVFVKWLDGKTRTVDVEESATVADLRKALVQKHEDIPDKAWTFRVGHSGLLSDDTPLAKAGLSATYIAGPPPVSLINDGVVKLLHQYLQELLQKLEENQFIFIGSGSYDNGHGLESIKRQQCRDEMFDWCAQKGWRLSIVLIDPAFDAEGKAPQIYNVADKGWIKTPVWATEDNLVRQYINLVHPLASVWTFATGIKEYHPLYSLTDPTKIQGLDFRSEFVNAVQKKRLKNCCLVMGNFYAEETSKKQYTTVGPFKILQACGFDPTG